MSKLDDLLNEYDWVSDGEGGEMRDYVPADKQEIKLLMLDTILEAVNESNGEAADIVDKYREKVAAL